MRMLTAKYGGDMSVDTDCDVYRLKIILPLPENSRKDAELKDAV